MSTGRTSRTFKRDVRALREDFKAPLLYDRQRKGFRYTEPGWQLPLARFSEGELLAFFTAHHVMHALVQKPEATLLQNALAKLATFLPRQVTFNPNMIRTARNWSADAHLRRGFSMMRGGRLTTVSLVFDAYQARWMRDLAGHRGEDSIDAARR